VESQPLAYYADTEDGQYVEDPDHVALLGMLEDLNTSDNTFFLIYPDDEALDWSISVHTRTNGLGGYGIERRDAATGQHDRTAAADHVTIVTEVLTWIRQR
jgi:hypothetical protein